LEVAPSPVPQLAIVALDVLSAAAFALVDGSRRCGLRGMLVFCGICVVVGNAIENIGVVTGFPYGPYYFATLMGPKLFHVPVLLGLAYIGMAYVSWRLGQVLVGNAAPGSQPGSVTGSVLAAPLVASFVMVAWDLAQDPVWATALHGWVWRDGGPWFGVPVSNYLGWYGTVFTIYVLFSLYLKRRPAPVTGFDRSSGRAAILFYAVCAAGNVGQMLARGNRELVRVPSGQLWRVADITAASALVSIFAMGAFAVLAWIRSNQERIAATD
jgi:putative membrane protein